MKRLGGLVLALALVALQPAAALGAGFRHEGGHLDHRADRQHGSQRDKKGDAKKTLDILKVSVTQTDKMVRATIHVRDLTKKTPSAFELRGSYSKFDGSPFPNMTLLTWANKQHKVKALIFEGEDGIIAHCDNLSATWDTKKNLIRLTSARTCDVNSWWGRKYSADSSRHKYAVPRDTTKLFKVS